MNRAQISLGAQRHTENSFEGKPFHWSNVLLLKDFHNFFSEMGNFSKFIVL